MIDLSLASIIAEARLTLRHPRAAARHLIESDPPMQARWLGFGLMAIASAILTHVSFELLAQEDRDGIMLVLTSPLETAALQAVVLLATIQMVWWGGRLQGGSGSFPDALLVMVWLQFLMLVVQVIQLVLMVLAPALAVALTLASFVLFLWLLTNFVAELHGFRSLLAVFAGLVFGAVVLAFGLALVLLLIGGTGA